ncbi:MAG: DUF4367 domain-containing protein [Candidatus Nitrosocaldus sp.]|nr:DUF4367 domain-containing protein [Candidatus Nitrosocaldus sp.]
MRHILFVIPVVISALVVVTLTAESDISLPTSSSTVRASADMYRCDPKSLEQVQLEFPVKEPTYLPEGYKLQVVDTTSFPGMVALYYAKYEMCHGVSLSNPGDVIVITVGDVQGSAKEGNIHAVNLMNDPVEHFKRDVESYNSVIPDAAKLIDKPESTIPLVRMIEVNGHVGKAREPMKGYNVYIINDGERSEKVVEELSDVRAGFVTFYHEKDKTMYSILSTFPVEEMLKIAESIP